MIRRFSKLQGCQLDARDGRIGKIKDLLCDDESWKVRYLVANTRRWLPGRRVLLSPAAVLAGAFSQNKLPVDLFKSQVESSPSSDEAEPVSDQYQRDLHTYYGWPAYWTMAPLPFAGMMPVETPVGSADDEATPRPKSFSPSEPQLRSLDQSKGCSVHAEDGEVGTMTELLVDMDAWTVPLFVLTAGEWLQGRQLVLPTGLLERSSWAGGGVAVHVAREVLQEGPEYADSMRLNSAAGQKLLSHWGYSSGSN